MYLNSHGTFGFYIVFLEHLTNLSISIRQDARWIHRNFLKSVLLGEPLPHGQVFNVPGNYAIANRIMRRWIEAARDIQWAGSEIPTVDIDEGEHSSESCLYTHMHENHFSCTSLKVLELQNEFSVTPWN